MGLWKQRVERGLSKWKEQRARTDAGKPSAPYQSSPSVPDSPATARVVADVRGDMGGDYAQKLQALTSSLGTGEAAWLGLLSLGMQGMSEEVTKLSSLVELALQATQDLQQMSSSPRQIVSAAELEPIASSMLDRLSQEMTDRKSVRAQLTSYIGEVLAGSEIDDVSLDELERSLFLTSTPNVVYGLGQRATELRDQVFTLGGDRIGGGVDDPTETVSDELLELPEGASVREVGGGIEVTLDNGQVLIIEPDPEAGSSWQVPQLAPGLFREKLIGIIESLSDVDERLAWSCALVDLFELLELLVSQIYTSIASVEQRILTLAAFIEVGVPTITTDLDRLDTMREGVSRALASLNEMASLNVDASLTIQLGDVSFFGDTSGAVPGAPTTSCSEKMRLTCSAARGVRLASVMANIELGISMGLDVKAPELLPSGIFPRDLSYDLLTQLRLTTDALESLDVSLPALEFSVCDALSGGGSDLISPINVAASLAGALASAVSSLSLIISTNTPELPAAVSSALVGLEFGGHTRALSALKSLRLDQATRLDDRSSSWEGELIDIIDALAEATSDRGLASRLDRHSLLLRAHADRRRTKAVYRNRLLDRLRNPVDPVARARTSMSPDLDRAEREPGLSSRVNLE